MSKSKLETHHTTKEVVIVEAGIAEVVVEADRADYEEEFDASLELESLKNRIIELETPKPTQIGDTVVFHSGHSRKADFPALVQELFPDGRARLWIFSVMSSYQQEALEGTGPNCWSRRK